MAGPAAGHDVEKRAMPIGAIGHHRARKLSRFGSDESEPARRGGSGQRGAHQLVVAAGEVAQRRSAVASVG